jgi:mannose-6-phosphate isomerase-like protein (cupin superfamily)
MGAPPRSHPRSGVLPSGLVATNPTAHSVEIQRAKERLAASGGYEIVHESAGLELGVYVLVAPEPDRQQPHDDDEVYVVLDGRGTLEVEGKLIDMDVGHATFVPAGADHRFVGYEQLSVLVIFEKTTST